MNLGRINDRTERRARCPLTRRQPRVLGAALTHGKLHEGLVVLGEHIEEQVQHLELPEVLVVAGIVGEVGQVRQHLLLGLCKGKGSGCVRKRSTRRERASSAVCYLCCPSPGTR